MLLPRRDAARPGDDIWLSGEGLTVETLQEIALPAEATMVIDDLARVLDPAVRREIVSMLDQPGLWLVLAGRCPLPSWLTGPYVNGRLSVIPEEDLRQIGRAHV